MITIIAVLYLLGIFLYYFHILTIHTLTSEGNKLDMKRVMMLSLCWPLMTFWYFYTLVLAGLSNWLNKCKRGNEDA